MANEEQVKILRNGYQVWNRWRDNHPDIEIDLDNANFGENGLENVNLHKAHLNFSNLDTTDLTRANLSHAHLFESYLRGAYLNGANLSESDLRRVNFNNANLINANLSGANLWGANLTGANLSNAQFHNTTIGLINLSDVNLVDVIGLETAIHVAPSFISTDTFTISKGKIPDIFLRGCGLSDWEIEFVKLYNPDLKNDEKNKILYKIYDLQASQAIQISPLFISYSHADMKFVDRFESQLDKKGIRFWRDIHEMKAGRIETQIDQAISQNRTVLLVLSEHSIKSDWVEHEVRMARELEKDIGRDVLCPIALDDSWKSSPWPKRVMEQIMEYNILDFSAWEDDVKFERMFRKLIDGLELFYKG